MAWRAVARRRLEGRPWCGWGCGARLEAGGARLEAGGARLEAGGARLKAASAAAADRAARPRA
ncbi:hypothetical protein DNK48_34750 [Streptomyces malaysiensis subsp. malaysiensis]|nr:hypothetical protein DNK48_34750 [Streptomyces malaysiensis]